MCLLECNVCGGITAVVLSRCRSLYLWISLDLHGILAIGWTPAYSVLSICVCWPPKRRIYHITSSLLHIKYVLPLCCLLKVSQYQLTLIDTASVHIGKGIFQHVHNTVTVNAAPRRRKRLPANYKLQQTNGPITHFVAGVSGTTLGGRDGLFSLIVTYFLVLL